MRNLLKKFLSLFTPKCKNKCLPVDNLKKRRRGRPRKVQK